MEKNEPSNFVEFFSEYFQEFLEFLNLFRFEYIYLFVEIFHFEQ